MAGTESEEERLDLARRQVAVEEARLELERGATSRSHSPMFNPAFASLLSINIVLLVGLVAAVATLIASDRTAESAPNELQLAATSFALNAPDCKTAVRRARLIAPTLGEERAPLYVKRVRARCTPALLNGASAK